MSRRTARKPQRTLAPTSPYFTYTTTPLACLLFILPLLILHEWGVRQFATLSDRPLEYRVAVSALMTKGFHLVGAHGRYLPAMAVVAVLLAWHLARKDRWVFNIPYISLMAVEGILLALPLIAVYFLFAKTPVLLGPSADWKLLATLYLGAGIYEEAVFRLAAFAALSWLLLDILRFPKAIGIPLVVVASACGFAFYHAWGSITLPWQAFIFLTLRGIYYGIIFLERGFALSVATHIAYDLAFLALSHMRRA